MSFSPETQLVYIPAQDIPFAYGDPKTFAANPLAFNTGIDPSILGLPDDPRVKAQVLASVRGYLKAWDPVTQKEVWRVEQPGAWNGGVLSTAGGLVFEGNAAGTFNAYSADKGAALWSFAAQTGVIAAPISYSVGGQQYVAVVVGWGGSYPLSFGEMVRKGSLSKTAAACWRFDSAPRRSCQRRRQCPFPPSPPSASRMRPIFPPASSYTRPIAASVMATLPWEEASCPICAGRRCSPRRTPGAASCSRARARRTGW